MSELDLGAGRQSTDSLPVGPFPVHSKRGFVGAGFCCAGQQCGCFSGLVPTKTLHIDILLSPRRNWGLVFFGTWCYHFFFGRPFRHRVVQSFLFGGYILALQAEASASFSARSFFIFLFSSLIEVRLLETLLWSATRRSCSWDLDEIRHSRQGPLLRRHLGGMEF